jgi:hypothetical protein
MANPSPYTEAYNAYNAAIAAGKSPQEAAAAAAVYQQNGGGNTGTTATPPPGAPGTAPPPLAYAPNRAAPYATTTPGFGSNPSGSPSFLGTGMFQASPYAINDQAITGNPTQGAGENYGLNDVWSNLNSALNANQVANVGASAGTAGYAQAGPTNISTAGDAQFQNQQNMLAQQLAATASGQGGPSPADLQLAMGAQQNQAAQLAALGSQRGGGSGNAALAARQAADLGAASNANLNQQMGVQRAQEVQAAQQAEGGVLGTARGQAQNYNLNAAQLAQQNQQFNAGNAQQSGLANLNASQQTALANQQAQLAANQQYQNQLNAILGAQTGIGEANRSAALANQQLQVQQQLGVNQVNEAGYGNAAQANANLTGAIMGGLATGGGQLLTSLVKGAGGGSSGGVGGTGTSNYNPADTYQPGGGGTDTTGDATSSATDPTGIAVDSLTLGGNWSGLGASPNTPGSSAVSLGNPAWAGNGANGPNPVPQPQPGASPTIQGQSPAWQLGSSGAPQAPPPGTMGGSPPGIGGFSSAVGYGAAQPQAPVQFGGTVQGAQNASWPGQEMNWATNGTQGSAPMPGTAPGAPPPPPGTGFSGIIPAITSGVSSAFPPAGGAPTIGGPPNPARPPSAATLSDENVKTGIAGGNPMLASFMRQYQESTQRPASIDVQSGLAYRGPQSLGGGTGPQTVGSGAPTLAQGAGALDSVPYLGPLIGGLSSIMGSGDNVTIPGTPGQMKQASGFQQIGVTDQDQTSMSDEREKKDIVEPHPDDLQGFLDSVHAHQYRYKDPSAPGAGHGTFVSPMAQELEQTDLGKHFVFQQPDGSKGVDYGKALGTMLAGQAMMNERLNDHEAMMRSMRR